MRGIVGSIITGIALLAGQGVACAGTQVAPGSYGAGVGHYYGGAQQNNGTMTMGNPNGVHVDAFNNSTIMLWDSETGEYVLRRNGLTVGERVFSTVTLHYVEDPPSVFTTQDYTDYDAEGQQTGTGHIKS